MADLEEGGFPEPDRPEGEGETIAIVRECRMPAEGGQGVGCPWPALLRDRCFDHLGTAAALARSAASRQNQANQKTHSLCRRRHKVPSENIAIAISSERLKQRIVYCWKSCREPLITDVIKNTRDFGGQRRQPGRSSSRCKFNLVFLFSSKCKTNFVSPTPWGYPCTMMGWVFGVMLLQKA